MAAITERRFRRLLGRLDTGEFVDFVAGLWDARGYDTRVEGNRVLVSGDRGRTVLGVRHDGSLTGRLRAALGDPGRENADVIVTSGDAERVQPPGDDGDVLGASDLYQMALYGIDRGRCAALFEAHLGRPPTVQPGDRQRSRLSNRVRTTIVVAVVLFVAVAATLAGPLGPVTPEGNTDGDTDPLVTTAFGGGGPQEQSGSPGGPTNTSTPTATATTTTTPTTTAGTAGYTTYDSGGQRLADAHADILENRSVRIVANYTQHTNGTMAVYSNVTAVFGPNRSRYSLTQIQGGTRLSWSRSDLWAENGRVQARILEENRTDYRLLRGIGGDPVPPREALLFDPVYVDDLPGLIAAINSVRITWLSPREIEVVEPAPKWTDSPQTRPTSLGGIIGAAPRGETSLYGFRASLSDGLVSDLAGYGNVRNATMIAVVDSNGRFYRYTVRYDALFQGESFRTIRRVTFDGVGSTVVERPAWYDRALNATGPTTTAGPTTTG